MKIKCLGNGLFSPNNCPNWQWFSTPPRPPPYGKSLFEQHFFYCRAFPYSRNNVSLFQPFQLEDMDAGDMETVGASSSEELAGKTNGSLLATTTDPSLTAEEGLRYIVCGILKLESLLRRLSASSSSESVTTVPPVSRVKEEPENLVNAI